MSGASRSGRHAGEQERYDALMEVILRRITNRAFALDHAVPRGDFELIVDAARHAPSPANTQPWQFVAVTEPETKRRISDCFAQEQARREAVGMKIRRAEYEGVATAPGLIAVAADFRFVRALPVPQYEDPESEANRPYYENAERILLQSVAAATMSAHLAAAALGYNVWWITAIGMLDVPEAIESLRSIEALLDVPEELSITDIMCFGRPATPIPKRWKKELDEVMSWERFDPAKLTSDEETEEWVRSLPVDAFGSGPPPERSARHD